MAIFFNEDGLLNIDETVQEMPSFKKMMEDGWISDEELASQAKRVNELLHQVEEKCSAEQAGLVRDVLAEINVLYAAYVYYQLQSIK